MEQDHGKAVICIIQATGARKQDMDKGHAELI